MLKYTKISLFISIIALGFILSLPNAQSQTNIHDLPKASADIVRKYNVTPVRIYQYAKQQQIKSVWYLRDYLDMEDAQKMTALCYAQIANDFNAYKLLIKAGASTNVSCHESCSSYDDSSTEDTSKHKISTFCKNKNKSLITPVVATAQKTDKTAAGAEVGKSVISSEALISDLWLKSALLGGAAITAGVALGGGGGGGSATPPSTTCPLGYATDASLCGTHASGWVLGTEANGTAYGETCYKCEPKPCQTGSTEYQSVANCGVSKNQGWTWTSSQYSGDEYCGVCTPKECPGNITGGYNPDVASSMCINNTPTYLSFINTTAVSDQYHGDEQCQKCEFECNPSDANVFVSGSECSNETNYFNCEYKENIRNTGVSCYIRKEAIPCPDKQTTSNSPSQCSARTDDDDSMDKNQIGWYTEYNGYYSGTSKCYACYEVASCYEGSTSCQIKQLNTYTATPNGYYKGDLTCNTCDYNCDNNQKAYKDQDECQNANEGFVCSYHAQSECNIPTGCDTNNGYVEGVECPSGYECDPVKEVTANGQKISCIRVTTCSPSQGYYAECPKGTTCSNPEPVGGATCVRITGPANGWVAETCPAGFTCSESKEYIKDGANYTVSLPDGCNDKDYGYYGSCPEGVTCKDSQPKGNQTCKLITGFADGWVQVVNLNDCPNSNTFTCSKSHQYIKDGAKYTVSLPDGCNESYKYFKAETKKDNIFKYISVSVNGEGSFTCYQPDDCKGENQYYKSKVTGITYSKEEGDTHGNITCYHPNDCNGGLEYAAEQQPSFTYENTVKTHGEITCYKINGCNNDLYYYSSCVKGISCSKPYNSPGNTYECQYPEGCNNGEGYYDEEYKNNNPDYSYEEEPVTLGDKKCYKITGCESDNGYYSVCDESFECASEDGKCFRPYQCNSSNRYYSYVEGFTSNTSAKNDVVGLHCLKEPQCDENIGWVEVNSEDDCEHGFNCVNGASKIDNYDKICRKIDPDDSCNDDVGYYDECPTGVICGASVSKGGQTCQLITAIADGWVEGSCPNGFTCSQTETHKKDGTDYTVSKPDGCNNSLNYVTEDDKKNNIFTYEPLTPGGKSTYTCYKPTGCNNVNDYYTLDDKNNDFSYLAKAEEQAGMECYKINGCNMDNNYYPTGDDNLTGFTYSTVTSAGGTDCHQPNGCDTDNGYHNKIDGFSSSTVVSNSATSLVCLQNPTCDNSNGWSDVSSHEDCPTGFYCGESSQIDTYDKICRQITGCDETVGYYQDCNDKEGIVCENSDAKGSKTCQLITGPADEWIAGNCPDGFICNQTETYKKDGADYKVSKPDGCDNDKHYYRVDQKEDTIFSYAEYPAGGNSTYKCYKPRGCQNGNNYYEGKINGITYSNPQGESHGDGSITCYYPEGCDNSSDYYSLDIAPEYFSYTNPPVEQGTQSCYQITGCNNTKHYYDQPIEGITYSTETSPLGRECHKPTKCNNQLDYYAKDGTDEIAINTSVFQYSITPNATHGEIKCYKITGCNSFNDYLDEPKEGFTHEETKSPGETVTCHTPTNCDNENNYYPLQPGFYSEISAVYRLISCFKDQECDSKSNIIPIEDENYCPEGFNCSNIWRFKDKYGEKICTRVVSCDSSIGSYSSCSAKTGYTASNTGKTYKIDSINMECVGCKFSCDTANGWTSTRTTQVYTTVPTCAEESSCPKTCYTTCNNYNKNYYIDIETCETEKPTWECSKTNTYQDYLTISCAYPSKAKPCSKGYTEDHFSTYNGAVKAGNEISGVKSGDDQCYYAKCTCLDNIQCKDGKQALLISEPLQTSANSTQTCKICNYTGTVFTMCNGYVTTSLSSLDSEYITYINQEGDFDGINKPLASADGSKDTPSNRTFDLYNSASSASVTGISNKNNEPIYNAYAKTDENSLYRAEANATLNIIQNEESGNNIITGIKSDNDVFNAYASGDASANASINIEDSFSQDNIIYGLYANNNAYNAYANGDAVANANININTNTNKQAYGIYAKKDIYNTSNENTKSVININHNGSGDVYGLYSKQGNIYNSGDININSTSGKAYGIYLEEGAGNTIENKGNISIKTSDKAYGIYVKDAGSFDNGVQIYNKGTIDINANDDSRGIKIENNGYNAYVENTGTISVNGDINGSKAIDLGGAVLMNRGVLTSTSSLNLDAFNATHILDGGTYIAESISGSTMVSINNALNNNEDQLVEKDSFIADDVSNVDISHQSTLYNTALVKNENNNYDVVSTRKNFGEFTANKSLADYLEKNYKEGNLNELYNNLKANSNDAALQQNLQKASGGDMLGLIPQENIQTLRHVGEVLTDSILSPTREIRRIVGGADSYRLERDETSLITGYDNNTTTTYMYGDKEINTKNRLGLGLAILRSSTSYDNGANRKENFISIFVPWIHKFKDNLNLASIFNVGYGFGSLDRGQDKADIKDYAYGITNRISYTINIGDFAKLEPQLFLNAIGYYQDEIKEKGAQGLRIKQGNHLSVEGGFGLFLKKMLLKNDKHSLQMKVGAAYYHEFADPFNKMKAGFTEGSGVYNIDDANLYDHDRAVLEAAIDYKFKAIDFYAKYYHLIQKNKSQIFDLGVKYNF